MGRHATPDEPRDGSDTTPAQPGSDTTPAQPPLRIVRGDPTPEEMAVLTALVAVSGSAGRGAADVPARYRWADPFDIHHRPWMNGPGGWRSSLRPQG